MNNLSQQNKPENSVDILVYYILTEGITEAQLSFACEMLPEWRRVYIEKKVFPEKINGAFSYLLLRKLALERFGVSDTAPFTYGKQGKPYFSNSKLFFSISHCRTAAAAVLSPKEIGLDIIDDRNINENIAPRICSSEEWERFSKADDRQKFLRELWCRKESVVKKSGVGFTKGFKTVETSQNHCTVFIEKNFTVSVAADPFDTVKLKEIPVTELIGSL